MVGWELASGPAWARPSRAPATCLSQGGGCALMNRLAKFQQIVRGMNQVLLKMTTQSPDRPTPGPAADHSHSHRCWTCR